MYFAILNLAVFLGVKSALSATPKDDHSISNELIRDIRISHGVNSTIEEFPYAVSIVGYSLDSIYYCGGAILSPTIILTAAHCFSGSEIMFYQVRAGSSYRDRDGSLHNVKKFIVHPDFVENNQPTNHDVAVLQLEDPIKLDNKTAKAISMVESGLNLPDGANATMAGWGRLSHEGFSPDQLQSLSMNIVDKKKCMDTWSGNFFQKIIGFVYRALVEQKFYNPFGTSHFDDVMKGLVCATSPPNNELGSVCSGDSGGPLVVGGKLAGILSFARYDCTSKPIPNAFTDVANYREWIDEKVKEFKID